MIPVKGGQFNIVTVAHSVINPSEQITSIHNIKIVLLVQLIKDLLYAMGSR